MVLVTRIFFFLITDPIFNPQRQPRSKFKALKVKRPAIGHWSLEAVMTIGRVGNQDKNAKQKVPTAIH